MTENARLARVGFEHRRQHSDRRRFARAIRAEQAEDLAGLNFEVDAVQSDYLPEPFAEVVGDDGEVGHGVLHDNAQPIGADYPFGWAKVRLPQASFAAFFKLP